MLILNQAPRFPLELPRAEAAERSRSAWMERRAGCETAAELQRLARHCGPIDTIQFGTFDPAEVVGYFAADDVDDRA